LKKSIQLQELKEEICFLPEGQAYLRIVLPLLSQWSKDIWLQRSGRDIKWYVIITRNARGLVSSPEFIHHGVPVKGLRRQDSLAMWSCLVTLCTKILEPCTVSHTWHKWTSTYMWPKPSYKEPKLASVILMKDKHFLSMTLEETPWEAGPRVQTKP